MAPEGRNTVSSLDFDIGAECNTKPGPCILVGHSYGGAVITEAGTDSHVAALVYIGAHAPEEGETEAANGKKFPNASKPLVKTPDGFVFSRSRQLRGRLRRRPAARAGRVHGARADAHCG
jgi:pimeloyl-ACP methyl ester carboxylesterase